MNIVITLPKHLIDLILSGDKKWEVRKVFPQLLNVGEDGFFCLQKGTKDIICWCRVDCLQVASHTKDVLVITAGTNLGVDVQWLEHYATGKALKLWQIGKVVRFEKPLQLSELCIKRAPQSFAYTPLSCDKNTFS